MSAIDTLIDNQIITHELQEEGGYTNDPIDKGGATLHGISQASNPQAWVNGPPTLDQARAIYETKYIQAYHLDLIQDVNLREQVTDYVVTSGLVAIATLQMILGVQVDHIIGPETVQALQKVNPVAVGNRLVAERVKMIGRLLQRVPSNLKFTEGWLTRATSYLHPLV